jgi:hypothetical protein
MIRLINTTGLIISIIGVIMLFFWGPPQPKLETGIGLVLEDDTVLSDGTKVADLNKEIELRRKIFKKNSRLGLILVLIGFVIQLIAQWIPDRKISMLGMQRKH